MMVLETSLYAAQFIADNVGSLKPHSKWKETDSDEMHVLGLLIYIGLLYKPRLSMYSSQSSVDELFHTPLFSLVMAHDRVFILIRFLHFADKK